MPGRFRSSTIRSGRSWRAWASAVVPIGGRHDAEAALLEVIPRQLDDLRLVVNHQDGFVHGSLRRPVLYHEDPECAKLASR